LNILKNTNSRTSALRLLKIDSLIRLNNLENIETELAKVKTRDKARLYELWLYFISKKKLPVETYMDFTNKLIEARLQNMA
jgi:hypothetical protein